MTILFFIGLTISLLFSSIRLRAQTVVQDKAVENQSQRMVFQQWDQNDFYPHKGF